MRRIFYIMIIVLTLVLAACGDDKDNSQGASGETNDIEDTNNNESQHDQNNNEDDDSVGTDEEDESRWEVVSETEGLKIFKGNEPFHVGDTALVEHLHDEYEVTVSSFMIAESIDGLNKNDEDNVYLIADARIKNLGEEELRDQKYLMNNMIITPDTEEPLSNCRCTLDDSQLSVFDIIKKVSFGVEGFSGKTLAPEESDSGQMVFEVQPADSYDLHFATNESVESVVYRLDVEDAESLPEDLSTEREDVERLTFGEGTDILIRDKEAEITLSHPTYKEITYYMNADSVDFDEKVLEFDLQIKNKSEEAIDLNDLLNSIIHFKLINDTGVKRVIHGSILEQNPVDADGEEMEEIQPGEEGWTRAIFDRVRPFEGNFTVFFHEMYPDLVIGKAWEGNHTDIVKEEE